MNTKRIKALTDIIENLESARFISIGTHGVGFSTNIQKLEDDIVNVLNITIEDNKTLAEELTKHIGPVIKSWVGEMKNRMKKEIES